MKPFLQPALVWSRKLVASLLYDACRQRDSAMVPLKELKDCQDALQRCQNERDSINRCMREFESTILTLRG